MANVWSILIDVSQSWVNIKIVVSARSLLYYKLQKKHQTYRFPPVSPLFFLSPQSFNHALTIFSLSIPHSALPNLSV